MPPAELLPRAFEVADKLGRGAQQAIRWTKSSLNNWLRMAGPIFDQSIALEMLTFMDEDVREGVAAIREKRAAAIPVGAGAAPLVFLSSRSSFPRRAASHPDAQTRQSEGGPS